MTNKNKSTWKDIVGTKRLYNSAFKNRDNVIKWDIFPVRDGERLKLIFETKNSEWRQGVWLMCDQGITISGRYAKSIFLWYDTSPKEVEFICHTKNGLLSVYNIWDRGFGPNSLGYSSGMLVEELPNGRRYRCNDIGFETNFDKLVFRIERIDKCTENKTLHSEGEQNTLGKS